LGFFAKNIEKFAKKKLKNDRRALLLAQQPLKLDPPTMVGPPYLRRK
jgi:hypothetical protein